MTPDIRWLIRRDMDAVLAIEKACFEFAWTEEDFLCCLRQRNCIGMVAERGGLVVGFMLYELHRTMLRIMNFAVEPHFHREGIGSAMVARLIDKLSQQRRRTIEAMTRETNLPAQLFFRSQGFRAVEVVRGYYDDTDEDAYQFEFDIERSRDVGSWAQAGRGNRYRR